MNGPLARTPHFQNKMGGRGKFATFNKKFDYQRPGDSQGVERRKELRKRSGNKRPEQENIRHKEATFFNKLIPLIIKYSKEQTYFKTSSPLSI